MLPSINCFRTKDFNHVTRFTFSHLRGKINRKKYNGEDAYQQVYLEN